MRKLALLLGLLAVCVAGPALALDVKLSGDLNHRFNVYTDQANMFGGSETIRSTRTVINEDGIDESWGEVKYRLWVEAATDDGKIKGVYAIEMGALRFGNDNPSDRGGGGVFSGDEVNIETRWAYTDFQLPWTENKARIAIGLQNVNINYFLWQETAMGVQFYGTAGPADYTLGWIRGVESFNDDPGDDAFEDLDNFFAKAIFKPTEGVKAGLFVLYQRRNPGSDDLVAFIPDNQYEIKLLPEVDFDIYNLGVDGSWSVPTGFGSAFVNWDLIYQGGSLDDNTVSRDVSAYLLHADVGANFGKTRLTYTVWYASGDDNPGDGDVENFMSTDVDASDSIIFFEGAYADDNYFTEAPYILDKGLLFNKLALDYQATEKLKVGAAVLYLLTAEDLALVTGETEDALGTEIDAYVSYKLFDNLEVALNAGYLIADDAMDFFEVPAQQNGKSDADVFRSTARVRFTF